MQDEEPAGGRRAAPPAGSKVSTYEFGPGGSSETKCYRCAAKPAPGTSGSTDEGPGAAGFDPFADLAEKNPNEFGLGQPGTKTTSTGVNRPGDAGGDALTDVMIGLALASGEDPTAIRTADSGSSKGVPGGGCESCEGGKLAQLAYIVGTAVGIVGGGALATKAVAKVVKAAKASRAVEKATRALHEAGKKVAAGEKAAAGSGVPLARAIEQGLVKPGGKLGQVLGGIERQFAAGAPKSATDALGIIQRATGQVGLEPGVATLGKGGEIILQNVGGITTTLGPNGSILVQRGSDVLLHLLP